MKSVPDGYVRLTANTIHLVNHDADSEVMEEQLSPYILQHPNSYFIKGKKGGWNPFISIYNWENGKDGGWDRFVHKIGQKPVVLDTAQIPKSESNMKRHLEFLGYYDSFSKGAIIEKGKKKAYVRYDVTFGKRYPIRGIRYEICDSLLEKDFMEDSASFLIREGVYLSEELLERESARSAQMLKDKGWYDFSKNYFFFEADTTEVPDSAFLTVSILRHTRNESEKSDIIHRKYRFGQVYAYPVDEVIKYRTALSLKVEPDYDT
ncbi:MAG: hypothetical protein KBS57_06115, partial [Alistipes sp.]|nr:hypothetical protein [Candidatus Minthomonas equi]